MVNVKAGFSALSQAFYDEVGRPNLMRSSNYETPASPVALPEISATSTPSVLPYGSTQHLHEDATDVAPARGRRVVPAGSGSDDVALKQERRSSRSTLVNVKEGLYAIRPALYEPIGEAHAMDTGSLATATAAICNANALTPAKQNGAAGQHAHAEFGCGTVGAKHHEVEKPPINVGLYIATGDGPNNDSRSLERVASSGSTFIQVSQL